MEYKRNEATLNRPEGDRVLDGTYVFIDMPSYIKQIKEEKAWEKNDRNGITIFKSQNITTVISALQQGAAIRDNKIDGFLTVQVLHGNIRVSVPDGDLDATTSQMITLHPNVEHSIEALSESILLLTTNIQQE